MNKKINRLISLLMIMTMCASVLPVRQACAETITEEEISQHQIVKSRMPVVVSLGDSFSSGEGGEDYYGMEKPAKDRILDEDWLAHRSSTSWPGQLTFENEEGIRVALSEYRYNQFNNEPKPKYNSEKWFFTASSGAVTNDFEESQIKQYHLFPEDEVEKARKQCVAKYGLDLPLEDILMPSMSVIASERDAMRAEMIRLLDQIPHVQSDYRPLDSQQKMLRNADNVDYVTITIGGNDVGFAHIIEQCVLINTDTPGIIQQAASETIKGPALVSRVLDYFQPDNKWLKGIITADKILEYRGLDKMLDDVLRDINRYGEKIKKVYTGIHQEAPDAAIIVAGYPELIYSQGGKATMEAETLGGKVNDTVSQFFFSKYEAETVNRNVRLFNGYLEQWVNEVRRDEKIPIYFVDVTEEFGDHGAYAPEACVNGIFFLARDGELDEFAAVSSGSFHPNANGRKKYAGAVQKYIDNEIELKQITGKVRVVDGNLNVIPASKGYTVELTSESDPSWHYTLKTEADGTFKSEENKGKDRGLTSGEYSIRVLDEKNRECGLLGNSGKPVIQLMYHTSKDLDILVSPGKQKVSGNLTIRTAKNKAVEADFSDDPLMLSFTDRFGRKVVCPAEDQTPITSIGSRGVQYQVELFPGDYTVKAYGGKSGLQYAFSVSGNASDENVSVPIGQDVRNKNLTLLGNSQTYVGKWVDEVKYESVFAISSTTRMILDLGKMMDASLTMEAEADINMYGWGQSGYPTSDQNSETYKGTWQELDDGIVFYLNGDKNGPIYFDLVERNTLKMNLNKLEALASSSSQEGLMMVAVLEVFKLAMSMDVGNLFGMSFGTSMNDMMGVGSTDDLLYFTKQK